MEKERFMPACVQMKTFNFNYNNSLMLRIKKKKTRDWWGNLLYEVNRPITTNVHTWPEFRVFYFLAKVKNLSVHLQMIF